MKKKELRLGTYENPSFYLFTEHKKDILSTRESLFSFLEKKAPSMSLAVKNILERKLEQTQIDELPLMFELFPWIIKDLTGLSWRKTHEVSINWLAVNLYISFLDDHLDSKIEIKADEFLGASLLSQKGLINLFKIVSGTKFEKLFTDSLFNAANFQLEDVIDRAMVTKTNLEKSKSASGKNQILIACAGALAASKEDHSEFIIRLTNKILIVVQFLDDLADVESDLKHNNITVLLNEVVKESRIDVKNIERKELIKELIQQVLY